MGLHVCPKLNDTGARNEFIGHSTSIKIKLLLTAGMMCIIFLALLYRIQLVSERPEALYTQRRY